MFKCTVCGSIVQNPNRCGVCSGAVLEIHKQPQPDNSPSLPLSMKKSGTFWSKTKIVALTILVVVVVSSAGAGTYLTARPSPSPSCKNAAVNYPTCNNCDSWGNYNSFASACQCNNGFVNPPSCDRACGNGAVNPPGGGGHYGGCDQCPDGRTDITCPPALPVDSPGFGDEIPNGTIS